VCCTLEVIRLTASQFDFSDSIQVILPEMVGIGKTAPAYISLNPENAEAVHVVSSHARDEPLSVGEHRKNIGPF
jgi:hypothetical protein